MEIWAMGRRLLHLVVAILAAALPVVLVIPSAGADNPSTLLGLVNNLRAGHGLPPLAPNPALTAAARQWSAHMAATGALVHNPALASQVPTGWTKLGENIGAGGNVTGLFNALVASPFHLANMLDPLYNLTGIGVVAAANGTLWLTEDFEAAPAGGLPPVTGAPTTVAPATVPPTTAGGIRPPTGPRVTVPPPTSLAPPPTTPTVTTAPPATTTTSPAPETDATPRPDLPPSAPSGAPVMRASALAAGPPAHRLGPWALVAGVIALISLAGTSALVGRRLFRASNR
jgi:hypothetical protein